MVQGRNLVVVKRYKYVTSKAVIVCLKFSWLVHHASKDGLPRDSVTLEQESTTRNIVRNYQVHAQSIQNGGVHRHTTEGQLEVFLMSSATRAVSLAIRAVSPTCLGIR